MRTTQTKSIFAIIIASFLFCAMNITDLYSQNTNPNFDPSIYTGATLNVEGYNIKELVYTPGYNYRKTIIMPTDVFPQLGLWITQQVLKNTIEVEDCVFNFVAEWACRYAYDGNYEILITRLTIEATSEECFDKIESYKAQIIDRVIFVMYDKATCFQGVNNIPHCSSGLMSTVFRVYIGHCGSWRSYNIEIGDLILKNYYYIPCETKTFCRTKYSYCYEIVNGKMKLKELVEHDKDNLYYCPPYEVYYDSNGVRYTRECRDINCSGRRMGFFELNLEKLIIPDIDGNPPYYIH